MYARHLMFKVNAPQDIQRPHDVRLSVFRRGAPLIRSRSRHGSALLSAVVFTFIISICLAGMGTLAVSHYGRPSADTKSAQSARSAQSVICAPIRLGKMI